MVMCTGDTCTIQSADASVTTPEGDAKLHAQCEAAPNCVEPRRGIYVVKRQTAKPAKAPGDRT
jgi:hypothetical protein